eukprot:4428043-Pyramimonas_sp.AAC.1
MRRGVVASKLLLKTSRSASGSALKHLVGSHGAPWWPGLRSNEHSLALLPLVLVTPGCTLKMGQGALGTQSVGALGPAFKYIVGLSLGLGGDWTPLLQGVRPRSGASASDSSTADGGPSRHLDKCKARCPHLPPTFRAQGAPRQN